jgi:hypothetical protein
MLLEQLFHPALRDGQRVQGVAVQGGQIQRQRAELETRHRHRWPAAAAEPFVQAAVVQRLHDPADQPVGLGLCGPGRQALQHDRAHAG